MNIKKWLFVSLSMMGLLGGGSSLRGMVTVALANTIDHVTNKIDIKTTPRPNPPLTYNFDEHWGIEGSVDAITAPADDATSASSDNDDDDLHGFLYTINGIYRFDNLSLFQPYVLAGIGIVGLKPTGPESIQSGNINAGIGAKFFVSDAVALHGEVRDIYPTTGNYKNDYNINLGISFLLGDLKKSGYKNGN